MEITRSIHQKIMLMPERLKLFLLKNMENAYYAKSLFLEQIAQLTSRIDYPTYPTLINIANVFDIQVRTLEKILAVIKREDHDHEFFILYETLDDHYLSINSLSSDAELNDLCIFLYLYNVYDIDIVAFGDLQLAIVKFKSKKLIVTSWNGMLIWKLTTSV